MKSNNLFLKIATIISIFGISMQSLAETNKKNELSIAELELSDEEMQILFPETDYTTPVIATLGAVVAVGLTYFLIGKMNAVVPVVAAPVVPVVPAAPPGFTNARGNQHLEPQQLVARIIQAARASRLKVEDTGEMPNWNNYQPGTKYRFLGNLKTGVNGQ